MALVGDAVAAQRAVMDAWRALPDDAWERHADTLAGRLTMVELDVGIEPADLPCDYVECDTDWLAEFRPSW